MPTLHQHRVRRSGACLAVAAALITTAGTGAAAASPDHTQDPERLTVTRALDRVVAAGAPGATVVIREGNHTTQASRGYADLAARTPMAPTQRTRVGSLTKTFVATVVLQLAHEHKLGLEDTVERWLPGIVPGGDRITVRHLLAHRAGLPEFYGDPTVMQPYLDGNFEHAWAPQELVAMATSYAPLVAPGAGWSYSNTNYIVLGLIAEAVTGTSIATELEQRIFEPLHLTDTSFPTTGRIDGPHAHGYYAAGPGPLADVTGVRPFTWTAGAVVSTPSDIARFYRALLRGRLLPERLMRTMQTTVPGYPGTRAGLGIFSRGMPCGTAWGHQGTQPGYTTRAWSTENGRRQIIVAVNLDHESLSPAGHEALETLIARAFCA